MGGDASLPSSQKQKKGLWEAYVKNRQAASLRKISKRE